MKTTTKAATQRVASPANPEKWLASVAGQVDTFTKKHRLTFTRSDRQLSASFEIGCFHALLSFYEAQGYALLPQNIVDGAYRYLTTPSGNPSNFSFVLATGKDGTFEIRQQVRVRSHVDGDICFTPDLLVLTSGANINETTDVDFAGGKRKFFCVDSTSVVAAHECKSTNPFPELLISFLGMVVAAQAWYPKGKGVTMTTEEGHLAPTLFVGGSCSSLHLRMVAAMQKHYPANVVSGLHRGTWLLTDARNRLLWKKVRKPRQRTMPPDALPEQSVGSADPALPAYVPSGKHHSSFTVISPEIHALAAEALAVLAHAPDTPY